MLSRRFVAVALAGCCGTAQGGCGGVRYARDSGAAEGGPQDVGPRERGPDTDGALPVEDGSNRDLALEAGSPPRVVLGPQPVAATPLAQGTLFAAPQGSGSACTEASPCDLWTGVGKAQAGDVLFLRGGVYPASARLTLAAQGTAASPILVESYPGELAILDGSAHAPGSDIGVRIYGTWYRIRRIEIRGMPMEGLYIGGTDNVVDGLHVHGCRLSGIQVFSPYEDFPYGAKGSRNTIQNCTVHDNSDVGLSGGEFANGGNADGIAISSGEGNQVRSCSSYNNSDDGIDTWRATNTRISHSIAHSNGRGDGDGRGFVAGGAAPSAGTTVEHSVAYANRASGFAAGDGKRVTLRYDTAFDNGDFGFVTNAEAIVTRCIAQQQNGKLSTSDGTFDDNSWQRPGTLAFSSTDPTSADFLRPVPGGGFDDIGAYANP